MSFTSSRKNEPIKNGGRVVNYGKSQIVYTTVRGSNAIEYALTQNQKIEDRFLPKASKILDGIVAHWDFDYTGSNQEVFNDSIHSYTLRRDTAASGVAATTSKFGTSAVYTSIFGSNLKFATTQSYPHYATIADVANTQTINLGQELTIALWHNPVNSVGAIGNLFKKGLGASDKEVSLDFTTVSSTVTNISLKASTNGTSYSINMSGDVTTDNAYHFYALRLNANNGLATLTIDNTDYTTRFSPTSLYRSTGTMMVASGASLKIDALSIWNRYLTNSEIDHLYNNRTGRTFPFGIKDQYRHIYPLPQQKVANHRAPRLGNQYQLGAPGVSSVAPNAHLYDLLIHSTDTMTYTLNFTTNHGITNQKNPNTVNVCYFSSMDVPTGVAGGLTPGRPITYNFATGIQPEWFLKNAQGERVRLYIVDSTPPSSFYWAFNPANIEAGKYFVNYIHDNIVNISGVDGIYFDWMQTNLSPTFNATSPWWRRAPIDIDQDGTAESNAVLDAAWVSGYNAMLRYNVSKWPENLLHLGNAGWWTGPEFQPYINGIMIEEFQAPLNTYTWTKQMQCYAGYQRFARHPRLSMIMACRDVDDFPFTRFCFASAMMADGYYCDTNTNSTGGAYSKNRWRDEFGVNRAGVTEQSMAAKGYFGAPLGDAYNPENPTQTLYRALDEDGIAHNRKWMREYEKVLVLCNPTTSSVTYSLNRPYRKITGLTDPFNDGSMVAGSITIAASGGCVLLKPEYFMG